MSARTEELKRKYIHKARVVVREAGQSSKLRYRLEVRLDIESRQFTESYRQTDGEPECIRQPKALAPLLDNRTIFIFEDERIVGNYGFTPTAVPCYPQLGMET